jgi:hypothetical protein
VRHLHRGARGDVLLGGPRAHLQKVWDLPGSMVWTFVPQTFSRGWEGGCSLLHPGRMTQTAILPAEGKRFL